MANDLYHLGVRPEQLRRDLGDCPEMLTAVIDEATEILGCNDGLEVAMDYANLMIGEWNGFVVYQGMLNGMIMR